VEWRLAGSIDLVPEWSGLAEFWHSTSLNSLHWE